nr:ROK family protein [uncultured Actinoplanes sp.]
MKIIRKSVIPDADQEIVAIPGRLETLEVAIDIGGTGWRVAMRDAGTVRILGRGLTGTRNVTGLSGLRDVVRAACGPDTRAGVAFPGAVDRRGVVTAWPNRPQWIGYDLRSALGVPAATPLSICDDGLAAMMGETRIGVAADLADLLFLTLGTGIGGGLVIDRRVRQPSAPDARTIGHLVNLGTARRCRCGRIGCLQTALDTLPNDSELLSDGLTAWPDGGRLVSAVTDLASLAGVGTVLLTGGLLDRAGLRTALTSALTRSGLDATVPPAPGRSALLGAFFAQERID